MTDMTDLHGPGEARDPELPGRLLTVERDAATLVRLYSGRPVEGAVAYELAGVDVGELNIFG
jgi:hypothetical protein